MATPAGTDGVPITVLVPESPNRPIVMYDNQAALRLAVVDRASVAFLDDSWAAPGVYFLLWPVPDVDNRLPVYVGEAAQGLRKRISQHVGGKDGWQRAILIARDTKYGFNSAQVGWLEGRLWKTALAADAVRPTNKTQPKDETLPDYDRAVLETVIVPIQRVMRLLGYPLDPHGEDAPSPAKTHYGVKVKDLVDAGKLTVGDTLVFTYPGHPASATVLAGGDLDVGGVVFGSPSAAAAKVRGGATNGWQYWALPVGDENLPLAYLRAQLTAPLPPKAEDG